MGEVDGKVEVQIKTFGQKTHMATRGAVSYTHLDVYKRQHVTVRLSAVLQKNKQWRWGLVEREAVSYTHLPSFINSLPLLLQSPP